MTALSITEHEVLRSLLENERDRLNDELARYRNLPKESFRLEDRVHVEYYDKRLTDLGRIAVKLGINL